MSFMHLHCQLRATAARSACPEFEPSSSCGLAENESSNLNGKLALIDPGVVYSSEVRAVAASKYGGLSATLG